MLTLKVNPLDRGYQTVTKSDMSDNMLLLGLISVTDKIQQRTAYAALHTKQCTIKDL